MTTMNPGSRQENQPEIPVSFLSSNVKASRESIPLDDLLARLTTHKSSKDKEHGRWSPTQFDDDGAKDDEAPAYGQPKQHAGGYRNIFAAKSISCLVADIDKTERAIPDIDEWARISGIKMAVATTYSHGNEGRTCCRVIIPLAVPVSVKHNPACKKTRDAEKMRFNQIFKDAQMLAFAELNVLDFDASALGIDRFYYGAFQPESPKLEPFGRVYNGELFDLRPFIAIAGESYADKAASPQHAGSNVGFILTAGDDTTPMVIDPADNSDISLRVWWTKYKTGVALVDMIAAAPNWPFDGNQTPNNGNYVITCPNEQEHSHTIGKHDAGAIAVNAADSGGAGFSGAPRAQILCMHQHCKDRLGSELTGKTTTDPLKMLICAVERDLLTPHDFGNPAFIDAEILRNVNKPSDRQQDTEYQKEEREGFRMFPMAEAIKNVPPPEYVIDTMLQRGHLSTLTGQVQSGKTAIIVTLALHVAAGKALKGLEVMQGPVVMFLGENPDDVLNRLKVALKKMKLPDTLPVYVVPKRVNIENCARVIRKEIDRLGVKPSLVIVDTLAAYIPDGADENATGEMKEYMADIRRALCDLPGRPCVLVPAHPIKYATEEHLKPRGASSIWAEVDDNFTAFKETGQDVTKLHFEKIRGSRDMEPIHFEIETIEDELQDARGRFMPTVVARPLSDKEYENWQGKLTNDLIRLLLVLSEHKDNPLPISELAMQLGWTTPKHEPQKSKTQRLLRDLVSKDLAQQDELTQRYLLTNGGEKRAVDLRKKEELGL